MLFQWAIKGTFLSLINTLNPYPERSDLEKEVFDFVMKLLSFYPFLVRIAIFLGILFFEFYPIFFLKSLRRFSNMKYEKRLHIIEEMLQKGGIRRNLARAFKALIQMAYYEHPWYMKKAGYSWAL